jgi:hypothetical protein
MRRHRVACQFETKEPGRVGPDRGGTPRLRQNFPIGPLRDAALRSPFTFPVSPLTLFRFMEQATAAQLTKGARVRVTQQIAARDYTWTSDIRGTIVDYSQKQTGSWYAHSKNDKLWLDRLTLRKDDGELITLNLDDYTHIELEPAAPAPT